MVVGIVVKTTCARESVGPGRPVSRGFQESSLQSSSYSKVEMAADAPAEVGRPMRYPYTFTAKSMQFPYKFHYQNSWLYRYFIFGAIVTLPVFYKINKLANSPGNVAAHAEKKRREAEGHH